MADLFANNSASMDAPASRAFVITPNDGADLPIATRGLFVGTGGDVVGVTTGGDAITFPGVAAGAILPVRFARINTASTASSMVGLA